MNIVEIEAGEHDVYVKLRQRGERTKMYALISSAKKFTAQLERVDDAEKMNRHLKKK